MKEDSPACVCIEILGCRCVRVRWYDGREWQSTVVILFLQEADRAAAPEANQEDGNGLKKSAFANGHLAFFSLFVICV